MNGVARAADPAPMATDPQGPGIPLVDPESGAPLHPDRPWSLSDGSGGRWPVSEGIPYLRLGRESLRRESLAALDAGDERAALVALLADQDDHARTRAPSLAVISRMIDAADDGVATLRDAMAALNFGPVADYFAHRWSAPTYLSGLALLGGHRLDGATVVEIACGIGHYLRDLAASEVPCLGVDVVFAKLWLARRFVLPPGVAVVCGDAVAGLPIGTLPGPAVAFCHDAFYFFRDKPRVIAALHRVIGDGGRLLIGHAHNRSFDHRGVSGEPWTPGEYTSLLPGCLLYDDAELARAFWSGSPAPPRGVDELGKAEAVAMAWGPPGWATDRWPGGRQPGLPRPGTSLRRNPMLVDDGGILRPRWPSPRFEAEYSAESGYLEGLRTPSPETLGRAMLGTVDRDDPEVDRLIRRRALLDLPERW